MYLEDGREIYESDRYPGYYIDADTGDFCDENGNYMGGNQDNGDTSYGRGITSCFIVYVSKTGRQYYPRRTKTANISMKLSEAIRKGYKPSRGYQSYIKKQSKRKK